jgi:hypothetical protein
MHFEPDDIRTINVLLGTDGTHSNEDIIALTQRFNAEAITETGIQLHITEIIPFDMSEQAKIWPACKNIVPCWADYVFLNGYKYDIAITFTANTPLINFLIGGVIGLTDTSKYRYIVLKTTDYRAFKHEVYHVFHHEHSLSGLMFPVNNFIGIPTTGTELSERSREEILRFKWREFK